MVLKVSMPMGTWKEPVFSFTFRLVSVHVYTTHRLTFALFLGVISWLGARNGNQGVIHQHTSNIVHHELEQLLTAFGCHGRFLSIFLGLSTTPVILCRM